PGRRPVRQGPGRHHEPVRWWKVAAPREHVERRGDPAEEIQKRAAGAHVVKGWNTICSPIAQSGPDFDGQAASVFLASDDDEAKQTVASLARDMGYDPIDCGPLANARDLERLLGLLGT